MKTSNNATSHEERYIKASNNGKFSYQTELKILNHLVNKFNFISKSEYARREGISVAGVPARLRAKNEMYVEMIGKTFIVP